MKNMTKRQHEILDAALDIIADLGIQRLTTKNLAKAVKVTEPALYRHFKSKFDILFSIISRYKNDMTDLFDKSTEHIYSPFEKIDLLYQGMFNTFVKRPALSMVIFSEDLFRYDKRLSKEVISIIEYTHDRINRILKNAANKGAIRTDVPAKQMAWIIMGTMRLLVAKWRISGYVFDILKEEKQAIAFLRTMMVKV